MAKAFFRWLRGELNGFYLTNINNALNETSKDIKDFLSEFKAQQFEHGKITDKNLYGLGKFAGIFLPRLTEAETIASLRMTDSHIENGTECSERGLFNTEKENFSFFLAEDVDDINKLATPTLRSSMVGDEAPIGYISSEETNLLDDNGLVRREKVLSTPPTDVAYSEYYGDEFMLLSEATMTYTNLAPALYMELFKALQWIRYNGISIKSLARVISVICPNGLVKLGSKDLIIDYQTINLPVKTTIRDVIYGNGLFVAVGTIGTILTSTDGITWTQQVSPTTQNLNAVAYGNGLYVAVGDNGIIMTSTDGITWTEQTSPTTTRRDVIYANGLFVDGITWTEQTSPTTTNWLVDGRDVIYANGLFVAVGTGGIVTSTDGINWEKRYVPLGYIMAVTYANGLFVTVTNFDGILTSPDGITWTKVFDDPGLELYGITYGNGLFVAVGIHGQIYTSPDGTNWTKQVSPVTSYILSVTYANGMFTAVGYNGVVLTSPDGINWTKQASPVTNNFWCVRYINGKYILAGTEIYLNSTISRADAVTVGSDGKHWNINYIYDDTVEIELKKQRLQLLEYIVNMKFAQVQLVEQKE